MPLTPNRPRRILAALLACAAAAATALPTRAQAATQYPLTVTDMAGRQVTIAQEPQRIALQDGRDGMMLTLLDRDAPFARVAIWNNLLSRDDKATWRLLAKQWPAADAIPDMGFGDNGQVDLERLLAARPQLVVFERRTLASLTEAGVPQKLAELGIPLLAVDTFTNPVPGAADSVTLLGKILNRAPEAADYTTYYNAQLKQITDKTAAITPQPRIFMEALAGRSGPEQCCFTHGNVGWGKLVQAIGAHNIGSDLLTNNSGDVTLETVLAQKPDVYVMTGSQSTRPNNAFAPFGYDADPGAVQTALHRLEQRPGFAQLQAAKDNRVFGIWHLYYSNVFNIVGMEYLAKFAYPDAFKTLDPADTYRTILAKFTHIPPEPFLFAAAAPPTGE